MNTSCAALATFIGITLLTSHANATVIYNSEKFERCRDQQELAVRLAKKEIAKKYMNDELPNRAQLQRVLQALESPAADDLDGQAIKSCFQKLSTVSGSPSDFLSFIDCGSLGEDGLGRFVEQRGLSPRIEDLVCSSGFTPMLYKTFPSVDKEFAGPHSAMAGSRSKPHYFAPRASCMKGSEKQDPILSRMVSFMWHGQEINRRESESTLLHGSQILDIDACTKHFEQMNVIIDASSDPELASLGNMKVQVRFANAMTCVTQEIGQNHSKISALYGSGDPVAEDSVPLSLIDASGRTMEWSCIDEQSSQD